MENDFLTEDTKAVILLCGVFGKDRSVRPLTLTEYSSLVRWLIGEKMRPADLLRQNALTEVSLGTGIDKQRLNSLLGRGVQLGFAVEEWQRNGIWVISRSDPDYPARYKQHLKDKAPALLFGAGERSLLSGGGLGIVGSRNVDQAAETFTREVAELCAYNRMPVVSGGARGVDLISMNAALEAGGVTIGILAENLLKKSVERSARRAIAEGRLLLLSPYHPQARFTVGTAMGRNKLIYAMADYGLVVSAEHKKGGTWAGAEEELARKNARPLFVRMEKDVPRGNRELLDLGALEWPHSIEREDLSLSLSNCLASAPQERPSAQPSLFDFMSSQDLSAPEKSPQPDETVHDNPMPSQPIQSIEKGPTSIYEAVLPVILSKLESPATVEELAQDLDVNKTQLNTWLKKAVAEKAIAKLTKPVRYKRLSS